MAQTLPSFLYISLFVCSFYPFRQDLVKLQSQEIKGTVCYVIALRCLGPYSVLLLILHVSRGAKRGSGLAPEWIGGVVGEPCVPSKWRSQAFFFF